MDRLRAFLLVLLGLLVLGSLAFMIAVRTSRWPRIQAGFVRLGDAVVTFALGLLGFAIVLITLRALGWLPSPT